MQATSKEKYSKLRAHRVPRPVWIGPWTKQERFSQESHAQMSNGLRCTSNSSAIRLHRNTCRTMRGPVNLFTVRYGAVAIRLYGKRLLPPLFYPASRLPACKTVRVTCPVPRPSRKQERAPPAACNPENWAQLRSKQKWPFVFDAFRIARHTWLLRELFENWTHRLDSPLSNQEVWNRTWIQVYAAKCESACSSAARTGFRTWNPTTSFSLILRDFGVNTSNANSSLTDWPTWNPNLVQFAFQMPPHF